MRTPEPKTFGLPVAAWAALVYALLLTCSARAAENSQQAMFETPDKAVAELEKAVQAKDVEALRKLFGPATDEIANPDLVQREHHLEHFAQRLTEGHKLVNKDENTIAISIGKDDYPFAIPLAKKDNKWFFDTEAGKEEILNRRIGHNELEALEVCRAYVQAQRDYSLRDCAGEGTMEYAQRFKSAPNARNGLYFETKPGEDPSPFGALVAELEKEGYGKKKDDSGAAHAAHNPLHGYFFKILTRQGKNAPGGKYDYVINDHLVAGFALLAYPAEWANSGVMTFIVNQRGKVYEKNLGEKTLEEAKDIKEYNPDETWKAVE